MGRRIETSFGKFTECEDQEKSARKLNRGRKKRGGRGNGPGKVTLGQKTRLLKGAMSKVLTK